VGVLQGSKLEGNCERCAGVWSAISPCPAVTWSHNNREFTASPVHPLMRDYKPKAVLMYITTQPTAVHVLYDFLYLYTLHIIWGQTSTPLWPHHRATSHGDLIFCAILCK
jgi:hypothetical protein